MIFLRSDYRKDSMDDTVQDNEKAVRSAVFNPASLTDSPAVILVRPQLGENIGMAARAMANFALTEMRLVAPRDAWPSKEAYAAASGATAILDKARVFESVKEAVSDLRYVYATTARARDSIKEVLSPHSAVQGMYSHIADKNRCGIMFGPENVGLNNDDIAFSDSLIMAPVNPDFASLNLAQAVLIVGYEWFKNSNIQTLGRKTEFDGPVHEGLQMQRTRPATRAEITGFLEHLEKELDASGFLRPPEKRPQMVRNIRNMFLRMGASEQEVRTLRGIVSSLTRTHLRKRKMP